MDREERIAGRIILSYSYRTAFYERGFDNRTKPGVVIFSYHYFPVAYAYPEDESHARIVTCISDSEAYDKYVDMAWRSRNDTGGIRNKFARNIQYELNGYTDNIKNFRRAACNVVVHDNGITKDAEDFLMSSESTVGYDEAKETLTVKYNVRLDTFYKAFGNENGGEDRIIKSNGFEFEINDSDMTADEIGRLAGEVAGLLPASQKDLCYGKVEVKKSFGDRTVGDYTGSEDIIRTGGTEDMFVGTMLHELGHRWRYKKATRAQLTAFRQAYSDANGKNVKLNNGDVVEYNWGKTYTYVGKFLSSGLIMDDSSDGERKVFKDSSVRKIVSINGNPVEKYMFPTDYSATSVDEFIAECFQLYCLGRLDERLGAFVKSQIDN